MKNILITLSDSTQSMLLQNGIFGPKWVNDKKGPKVSVQVFNELLNKGYIKALNRVTKSGDGCWYTITQQGRDAIKTLISFDIKY